MKWMILYLLYPALAWGQSCQDNDIQLQVLGSGGPELTDGRVSSSHLIWVGGKAKVLVDAGGGSAQQFEKTQANLNDLDAILLTHLHVDHSADLPTLIKALYFTERQRDLMVMGPAGNHKMPDTTVYVDQLFGIDGAYRYLNSYVNPDQDSDYKINAHNAPLDPKLIHEVKINETITAKSIAVNHGPISAVAWRVEVGDCSITFSGDMSNAYNSLAVLAKKTDLLVANNVIQEGSTGVGRRLHMPPSEIGKIAKNAMPKQLLLAHFMRRSDPVKADSVKIIKQQYGGQVLLAEDLMFVEVAQ